MWNKLTDRVMGKDTSQKCHIYIIHADGSQETVNSSNLYHAFIQATTHTGNDVQQKAVELRTKVREEVRKNVPC